MTHDPKDTQQHARRLLEIAGSPSAALDASALMHKVQRNDNPWDPLSDAQMAELNRYIQRRAQREPISHIVGKRAFWMHDFIVTNSVLDPRPDTEALISVVCDLSNTNHFATVLDLGTGSGCILLSILYELRDAKGVGVDISDDALAVAQRNAEVVGVAERATWQVSDWFDAVNGRFDLIVSNPPYIALDEMPDLAPELGFEPRIALTDEADGLTAYRIITEGAGAKLNASGRLIVEIGPTQAQAVKQLFANHGFGAITVHPDLDGRDRVVSGVFSPQNDGF